MVGALQSNAWRALQQRAQSAREVPTDAASISEAFVLDPDREKRFRVAAAGIELDLSHQAIDGSWMEIWSQLFDQIDLRAAIHAMWAGRKLNTTEDRSVLHVALRQNKGDAVGGSDIEHAVLDERTRMLRFAESVRASARYRWVINIGIGGSDLGPALVCSALRQPHQAGPTVAFVSNVDGCVLADLLAEADPAQTLFILCSKTFTTQETMAHAVHARDWIVKHLGVAAVAEHFVAVSTNDSAMDAFGIAPESRFQLWDWVGGRYSLWSSIGLSIAIMAGEVNFARLLAGAREMDRHFASASWAENAPAILGALGIWNAHFLGLKAHAILPYTDRLSLLPAFLQQLEMESNGKSVQRDGSCLTDVTCPVIWGAAANNAQHSFFQALHQGSRLSSMDFILIKAAPAGAYGHSLALANALAQIEAFTMGFDTSDPHRRHEGSRPLSVLLMDELSPERLGSLLALYEHKVFVQAQVWGINAFDQFGVELGKKIANTIVPALTQGAKAPPLASVRHLMASLKS